MSPEQSFAESLHLKDCLAELSCGPSCITLELRPASSCDLMALHRVLPDAIRRLRSILSSTGVTAPLWVSILMEPKTFTKMESEIREFESDQEIARGEFVIEHRAIDDSKDEAQRVSDPAFTLPGGGLAKEPLTSAVYLEQLRKTLASTSKTDPLCRQLYDHVLQYWQTPAQFDRGLAAWRDEFMREAPSKSSVKAKPKAKPKPKARATVTSMAKKT